MKTVVKKLYEAMFLVDSAQATDWDRINTIIKNILERSEAEIVSLKKWDERKLAYEINGQSRGTYILCYFEVDGEKIRDIEREVRLSEQIMRVLILSAENMSQKDIEKDTPTIKAEKQQQKLAQKAKDTEAEQTDNRKATELSDIEQDFEEINERQGQVDV